MIKALNHPNIVNVIIEYFEDTERLYVVMEWLKGGELYQDIILRIKERRRFTER